MGETDRNGEKDGEKQIDRKEERDGGETDRQKRRDGWGRNRQTVEE